MKLSSSIFYLLLIIILVILLIFISLYFNLIKNTPRKYEPFASLPPINISEDPKNIPQYLISNILDISVPEKNMKMIKGEYKRFPLNENLQKTSIVAVEADNENQSFASWHLQVDKDNTNFVWPDVNSSYWASVINFESNPIVVIKGQFANCRYFSYYSYGGIEISDKNKLLFGQGLTENGNEVCNPTIPNNCKGLHDIDIDPDEGSKNPFTDKTYNPELDDSNYTIYFVSPDYKGLLPKSKNILPLGLKGYNQAIIIYRIYAPFNPVNCNSQYYISNKPFNTEGCPNKNFKMELNVDGGAAYPSRDKSSPCGLQDKSCILACVDENFAKTLEPDCYEYIKENKYCVCSDKNKYGKCAQYIEKIMRKCSNGMVGFDSYCATKPDFNYPYCVDEVKFSNGKTAKQMGITKDTDCSTLFQNEEDQQKCGYVKLVKMKQCISSELYKKTKDGKDKYPDLVDYRSPNTLMNICNLKDTDPLKIKMAKIWQQCGLGQGTGESLGNLCSVMQLSNPTLKYNPDYDFTIINPCDKNKKKNVKENFTTDTSKKYYDIMNYTGNTISPTLYASSGWVSLPDVFIKYNFNDYFIRLNNYQNNPPYQLLMKNDLTQTKAFFQSKNKENPLNPYLVSSENIDIPIDQYAQSLEIRENFDESSSYLEGDVEQSINNFLNSNNFYNDNDNNFYNDNDNGRRKKKQEQDRLACINHTNKRTGEAIDGYVNENNYLGIGARFPQPKPNNQQNTRTVEAPGCQYWADVCSCQNKGKKNAGPCNEATVLDCEGNPCFKNWIDPNNKNTFKGDAVSFSVSANVGDVIIFPNPDMGYVGAPTTFENDKVYVIWMDVPTTPITPGFENIRKNNYQMRYWSIGHYMWEMKLNNPRPVLSTLMDQDTIKIKQKKSERVCILLCSAKQYEILHEQGKLNEKTDQQLTWLNWGQTKKKDMMSAFTDYKDEWKKMNEDDFGKRGSGTNKKALKEKMDMPPKYGFLIFRQLFPNKKYKEAIEKYTNSKPDCITKKIPINKTQPYKEGGYLKSPNIAKSCNPGPGLMDDNNTKICDAYNLDPCCVATDMLKHMKNYYPRCEKINLCDIPNATFWDKYINGTLPEQPKK
jgi:hypothetical protein